MRTVFGVKSGASSATTYARMGNVNKKSERGKQSTAGNGRRDAARKVPPDHHRIALIGLLLLVEFSERQTREKKKSSGNPGMKWTFKKSSRQNTPLWEELAYR